MQRRSSSRVLRRQRPCSCDSSIVSRTSSVSYFFTSYRGALYRPRALLSHPVVPVRWSSTAATVTASTLSTSSSLPTAGTTTLTTLQAFVQQRNYDGCVHYYEQHFDPSRHHFLDDFCRGYGTDARDVAVLLIRVYTSLGRIDKVRDVLSVAMRDLAAVDELVSPSPLSYASLDRGTVGSGKTGASTSEQTDASLRLNAGLLSAQATSEDTLTGATPITYHRPSLLNVSLFNAYLEALTRRKKFSTEEVVFLLDQMKAHEVDRDALTYHYLVELHVRADYDPSGLWQEMAEAEPPITPLPATVQTMLLRVVPTCPDASLVVDIAKAALQHGSAVMDKRMLAELMEQWLSPNTPRASSPAGPSISDEATSTTTSVPSSPNGTAYPPEYVLWLMLELELRCVMEKASFVQFVQRHHLTELLLRCAKCTDAGTAEQVLALMDRHALSKTADVLALVVWCWSQALEVEKALDLIEWMALKGYLDQVDCFRKAYVDSLRYTMERHYLMIFAESLSTVALVERALNHLQVRRQRGDMVSAHTLDLIVLAFSRLGEERRALQLVATYETRWGLSPRTATFNALLVGCSRHHTTMLHRVIYTTMVKSGVSANVFTFRVLIRHAVVSGSMEEALGYLEHVSTHPGLRVEVEMLLPIIERAARVGDLETVLRVSQFSLKCDIGIDGGVLRSVLQQLTEAGQSVDVLKGQLPLHEALRSRSKAGRQRARTEVLV